MGIEFEAWHLWVILALTLAALEMLALGFVALAAGVACLAGALVASAGQPFWIQLAATAIAAAVLTPLFIRWYKSIGGAKESVSVTGDSGSQGLQTEIVIQQQRLGVMIKGDFFPAQLEQAGEVELQEGQQVEILGFSGITAQVRIL
ncbi:MAG: hypothetical protein OQK12_16965 [Motiliproteus sp.]|nr:hypothetical protein [Motiliproteus sp.]MCW9050740.1 hypothetical protein [Motiliproteus sp.]